jgi:hypothetical protein
MSNDQVATLQDVFEYIRQVTRQSQLIIMDAVEALRRETKCYFKHMDTWDYVERPNVHFLDMERLSISRVWVTFVPEGMPLLGALFYIHSFQAKQLLEPALMFGALDPGGDKGFDEIDRWAAYYTITDVEGGQACAQAIQDGPSITVTNTRPGCFAKARLVRVPLESIASSDDLQRIVVKPLVALVRGEVEEAKKLLEGVRTMPWPTGFAGAEDQEDEIEQV